MAKNQLGERGRGGGGNASVQLNVTTFSPPGFFLHTIQIFKTGIWKKLSCSPHLCEVNCLTESISGSHISPSPESYRYHFITQANKTAFPNITNPIISGLVRRQCKLGFHQFFGGGLFSICSPR